MNIKRRFIGTFVSVLCFCIAILMWHGRSSANSAVNPDCQPVSVIPQNQSFSSNFLNRINNQRPYDNPVRPLIGAENAANYIAQYIAADPSRFDLPAISDGTWLIDNCPVLEFLNANVIDGRDSSAFIYQYPIPYDSSMPYVSADDFYNKLSESTSSGAIKFMQDIVNVNEVREVGTGYAQAGSGDHYAVFVLLMSQTRGDYTISSAHYTPNIIPVSENNPLYDGCIGTPTSTNSAFGENFSELETQINTYLINNQLRDSDNHLNQDDQTVTTLMGNLAQYLAEDMAHDYYVPFDLYSIGTEDYDYDTDEWIVNRDENGELYRVCEMRTFIEDSFEAENYAWSSFTYLTLDNSLGSVDEVFDFVKTWDALADMQYQYMGVGYAKAESGSARFAIVLAGEPNEILPTPMPTPTPTAIPVGILPTPMRTSEGQGGVAPVDCQPSNGMGGFVDNNGDPIMPGQIAEATIFGHPVTVIVGDGYDAKNPTLMTFYLHGDEGNYQAHNSELVLEGNGRYYPIISDLVRENGWIYIAPQAPARIIPTPSSANDQIELEPPWHPWYGGVRPYNLDKQEAQDNMNALKEIFLEVRQKYNVCQNVSLGSTASGGSYFYDGLFFPMNGQEFPAFVKVHCGSGGVDSVDASGNNTVTPWNTSGYYAALEAMATNPSLLNRTELAYVMDEQDNRAILWPNIWYSIRTYDTLGFNLQREVILDREHCSHSIQQVTADYWEEKFALIQSSLPTPIPANTLVPTPTDTPLPTPTDTPLPTPTDTPLPTPTDTPLPTPTDTPLPTPTDTPLPTPTDTPLPTPTDTPLPTPTDTPLPTPTDTPLPVLTSTPEIPLVIRLSDTLAVSDSLRFLSLLTAITFIIIVTVGFYKLQVHHE